MKKSKIAGLLILSTMALSACGTGSSNSNGNSEASSNVEGSSLVNDSTLNSENNSVNSVSNSNASNNSEGPSNVNDWSALEKSIFTDYFYGVEVPYMEVKGSSSLMYNSGIALKTGGNCTPILLQEYALLFDLNKWNDYSIAGTEYVSDYGYYYEFETSVTTSNGTRYVDVLFGALGEDEEGNTEISTTGNGEFFLQIQDPYFYEWPSEYVDYYTAAWGTTEIVPAFDGADFIQISEDYAEIGILGLYCYTSDSTSVNKYASTLVNNGWKYLGTEDGYKTYQSPRTSLEIDIGYDSDYEDLDILIYYAGEESGEAGGNTGGNTGGSGEENPLGGADVLTIDTFGLGNSASGYQNASFTSTTTGASYDICAYNGGNIQLRSKNGDSGLVTKASGGTIKSISVVWNASTAEKAQQTTAQQAALTVQIYASNTPFNIAQMYGGMTPVGTISYRDNQTSYEFTTSYKYVGLRSENGAVNLDSITITWSL